MRQKFRCRSPVKSKASVVSAPSITISRPKLLAPMTESGRQLPSLKESRSEMSMQDLQKRAQAEAAMLYTREPPTLAEEDNFDVTSSEEPTPRRDLAHKFGNERVENGHGNGYRGRSIIESDV